MIFGYNQTLVEQKPFVFLRVVVMESTRLSAGCLVQIDQWLEDQSKPIPLVEPQNMTNSQRINVHAKQKRKIRHF